jgi:hypothetical protein
MPKNVTISIEPCLASRYPGRCLLAWLATLSLPGIGFAADPPIPTWTHLSSSTGDLPAPDVGMQVSTLIFDVDRDGRNDIVIAGWGKPSIVWYRNKGNNQWDRYVIDNGTEYIEAGGAAYDIDGDGALDIVEGGDFRTLKEVWWWENPYPHYDPNVPWNRHLIKNSDEGGKEHHDQLFGDFKGDGKAELIFWNQDAGKLFLAQIPPNPRTAPSWPLTVIYKFPVPKTWKYEGLATGDINGDGRLDIVGAGRWFENLGGYKFREHDIDPTYYLSRSAVGHFIKGSKWAQVVLSSGDGDGPLNWYEHKDGKWIPHTLLPHLRRAHTLQVADINGDGNDDIFVAEMSTNHDLHFTGAGDSIQVSSSARDEPDDCHMWIFYGDGKGGFTKTLVETGIDSHESKLGDLNGDGKLDIVQKPIFDDRIDIWMNDGSSAHP